MGDDITLVRWGKNSCERSSHKRSWITEIKKNWYTIHDVLWSKFRQKIELEDPTALIDQVYLGCTQWEAKKSEKNVKEKSELFIKITHTGTDVWIKTILARREKFFHGVMTWKDSHKNAELAHNIAGSLHNVSNLCVDISNKLQN